MKLLCIVWFTFLWAFTHDQTPFDAMISSERAFASQALKAGNKKAFLTFMADSAIMYHKGRLGLAKPVWQTFPESADKLYWGPAFADISQAGDMGFTTGPWYLEQGGKRSGEGSFITVWKRQTDGHYKFLFDLGIDYKRPDQRIPGQVERPKTLAKSSAITPRFIVEADQQFAKQVVANQPARAYAAVLSQDAHLFRPNQLPLSGNAISSYLATETPIQYAAEKGEVAESGDLAYVYGSYQSTQDAKQKGVYVRIWKNEAEKGWRIIAELLTP